MIPNPPFLLIGTHFFGGPGRRVAPAHPGRLDLTRAAVRQADRQQQDGLGGRRQLAAARELRGPSPKLGDVHEPDGRAEGVDCELEEDGRAVPQKRDVYGERCSGFRYQLSAENS